MLCSSNGSPATSAAAVNAMCVHTRLGSPAFASYNIFQCNKTRAASRNKLRHSSNPCEQPAFALPFSRIHAVLHRRNISHRRHLLPLHVFARRFSRIRAVFSLNRHRHRRLLHRCPFRQYPMESIKLDLQILERDHPVRPELPTAASLATASTFDATAPADDNVLSAAELSVPTRLCAMRSATVLPTIPIRSFPAIQGQGGEDEFEKVGKEDSSIDT